MYEKRLFKSRVLRFMYAPPFTKLDDVSEDNKPKPPYREAPFYMRSGYYYWWAFLRENDDYIACCERGGTGEHAGLYNDFGDIREDDFFKWWRNTGRELFCEQDGEGIEVFLSASDAKDKKDHVLMSIPIQKDMDHLVAEFKQLIKPLYNNKRKDKDDTLSTARYPIHSRPVVSSLHRRLMVYQTHKAHTESKMSLSEIGSLAGVTVRDKEQRAVVTRKHLTAAQNIIRNVVLRKFPVSD
jgi:hypothetical protein